MLRLSNIYIYQGRIEHFFRVHHLKVEKAILARSASAPAKPEYETFIRLVRTAGN